MKRVRESLSKIFPDIIFTVAITTPAYDMPEGVPPYSNLLAKATTSLSEEELKSTFKKIEQQLGDTQQLRHNNIVMMDIDLLQYNNDLHHHNDWQRTYVKDLMKLLPSLLVVVICALMSLIPNHAPAQNDTKQYDAELLGKAVEYYQSEKYHECILTFERLEKRYKLNPRFKAYLGMSYFKESKYEEAAQCLKEGIPELTVYSPKEQAVYIYSCAESLFRLENYQDAIKYYAMALPLTEYNNKGDVLFHTAFAHHFMNNDSTAIPLFQQALEIYRQNYDPNDNLHTARQRQTEIMLKGMIKPREAASDETIAELFSNETTIKE
ncbi:MAG: 2-amino-4-hydroxy-6-hydroxymethyldihydropteridine diphosphokinase [Prevotella sp.]|nr:2-amino-4-hydroxy-6-hydroxymethyldihydropteridine diphosphokinase [Candidatus Prevotella equi]